MSEGGHGTSEQLDQTPEAASRRRFLGYASGLLSGVIAAALGLPLARFFLGHSFRKKEARWLELGPLAEVEAGRPKLFRASYLDTDGWRQTARRQAVYAVRVEGRELAVFSNACTHLGCPVHRDEPSQLFLCPCHNGGFLVDGRVAKGPAPRALDRVEHKVEDDALYIKVAGA
jgi:menaquinol-cytochrome c reductase iron-sulfur subunit